jgi:antitoxin YefM
METIFKIKAEELDSKFIETIKNLFKDRELEISIKPIQDETEYLLSSPANKKHLMDAIKDVKKNKNLIRFTTTEFKDLSAKLLSE